MICLKLWLQIALEWLHECCMPCVVGRKPEHETLCFPCKVAAAGDERYLVCAAVAAAVVPAGIGSSSVFCNEWLFHVVPVCVVLWCFACSCDCRSHWNGWMNAAWALFCGGSRRTKPCVFPCKVAPAGDERYLVCAAGAAGVVWFLLCVCNNGCSCVRSSMLCLKLWLQIALEWLHECCMPCVVGRKPEHETLCFFRVKWLKPAMKGTSCVRGVRLGSFGSFYVFCNNGCSCVRSSIRFLKLWLQIALEWLHECCMPCVVWRKPEHETLCFSV